MQPLHEVPCLGVRQVASILGPDKRRRAARTFRKRRVKAILAQVQVLQVLEGRAPLLGQ